MPSDYSCPSCGANIPLDDVNVSKDVALCRACGQTTAFSVVSGTSELSLQALDEPPRGVRIETGFNNETTVVYHRLSPLLLFLIPFTALWSGGSMIGIYGSQIRDGKFDLGQSLFGIPFLLGTVVLLSVIAFLLFGKWVIKLDRGDGTVFVGVGPFGWTRRFSYNQTSVVSLTATTVTVNNRPQQGILVRTDERDFVFGALLKDDAKRFIAATILQQVGQL
jgi:hypothetical protein